MHKYGPPGRLTLPEMHKAGQRPVFFITFIILSVIFLFFKKDSHVAIFISLLLLTQRILRITEENIRHSICQKSFGGGMQGGTWNCPGFPCKQNIVYPNLPPAARRA